MGADFKLHLKADKKLEINSPEIKFNSGTFGGVPKVSPTVAKLNKLEAELNQLKGLIASWVIVPGDGGLALKTLLSAAWTSTTLTPTTISDLENPKILQ